MAEPIVVNTGPLISFARVGCLDLIGRLPYEFLCPAEVWQELDEGRASGIDEWKGRRGALASGLRVTGSLGLLGRAKAEGLIPELKPLVAKAIDAGIWDNRELVRSFLEAAGE